MITPSFSLTATERVLPRLALDFTTASLDSRVTFTRTGAIATRINSSGYVENVAADTPRFDFNSVTLACKGLLIEEARTNVWVASNDFSTNWTLEGVAVTANSITSPDNTVNASLLVASSGNCRMERQFGITGGATYSFSVFVKKGTKTTVTLQLLSIGGADPLKNGTVTLNFDTAGLTVSGDAINQNVEVLRNGWYRLSASIVTSASHVIGAFYMFPGGGFGATGECYSYGAQLEVGAFATSYIPTAGSQVTRTADVANMTGTNFSSWYNATEGAFVTEATNFYPPKYQPILRVDNGAISDSIYFDIDSSAPRMVAFVSSANQCVIGTTTLTANTKFKLVGAYKLNSYAASLNAGSVGTDNLATVPTVNRLLLGNDGVNIFNGIYAKINYYPQRLINAEVQAFSK